MDKAREFLRNEARRMLEVENSWNKILSQYLVGQGKAIDDDFSSYVRALQANENEDLVARRKALPLLACKST